MNFFDPSTVTQRSVLESNSTFSPQLTFLHCAPPTTVHHLANLKLIIANCRQCNQPARHSTKALHIHLHLPDQVAILQLLSVIPHSSIAKCQLNVL